MGRFLNADSIISGIENSIQGCNLFSYCFNDPVNRSDTCGNWPQWLKSTVNLTLNAAQTAMDIAKSALSSKSSNVVRTSSHDANRRPNRGEPGSTWEAPNGDKRTYGPDGRPKHDYDHNDHGFPDSHPHDENGGHNHDWDWSKTPPRGEPYAFNWEPVAGVVILTICVAGIIVVVADNLTGVGIADDALLGPLGAGVTEALTLIFG